MSELWVFGYGSLIWRPGFPYLERRVARLIGAHRALCVYSWVHRGTPDRPGLVLGLDRGGTCRGLAFRVRGRGAGERRRLSARARAGHLRLSRADAGNSLRRRFCGACAHLSGRPQPRAICGQARRGDAAAHGLQVRKAARARIGDYVIATAAHLAELGMPDRLLERLSERLRGAAGRVSRHAASRRWPADGWPQILDDGTPLLGRRGQEVHVESGATGPCRHRHQASCDTSPVQTTVPSIAAIATPSRKSEIPAESVQVKR